MAWLLRLRADDRLSAHPFSLPYGAGFRYLGAFSLRYRHACGQTRARQGDSTARFYQQRRHLPHHKRKEKAMDSPQKFHGRKGGQAQTKHRRPQSYTRKKVVIRSKAQVRAYEEYLLIRSERESVISYRYIYSIFLYLGVEISLRDLYRLAKRFRVYLIDGRGYLIGKVYGFQTS